MINPLQTEYEKILETAYALQKQGKSHDAMTYYQKALKINNNDYLTYLKMGDTLLSHRNPTLFPISLTCYHKSLQLKKDNPAAYHKLGHLYKILGQTDDALAALQKALELDPGLTRARFTLLDICCPILYEQEEDLLFFREVYSRQLHELSSTIDLSDRIAIDRGAKAVGKYPFHLAYQGYNDCSLQRQYGNLVYRIQSARYPEWQRPIPPPGTKAGEPLRIGIVSGFFRSHSNWKMRIGGWLKKLDRRRFALYGYYTGKGEDACTEEARKYCTRFVEQDFSLTSLCQKILDDKLHVLIYPEIGMNRLVVRLSSLRLAPVQCTSWGHPTTSGLPTMDYFLSSDLMEPEDCAEHYTETVIRLPNLSCCYSPPLSEAQVLTREVLGLKADRILYLCVQSLFKYLPQYDDVFPRIAKKTGACQFVFLTGRISGPVLDKFRRRLASAFARYGLDSDRYIVFLQYLSNSLFLGLNRLGDVYLDSIGWSGCNTTMEAIANDLPVVTLPGPLLRGRHSFGILKMTGQMETIATSLDDYVDIAVRLGTNNEWRKQIRAQIASSKHKLYDDMECIEALQDFLEKAVVDYRTAWGNKET